MNNLNIEDLYISYYENGYTIKIINLKYIFINVGLSLEKNYSVINHKKFFENKLKKDYKFKVSDQFRNQILNSYYSTIESLRKRKLDENNNRRKKMKKK